jgi:3',5'-cyclic AMP phosphodiesterase CpdA
VFVGAGDIALCERRAEAEATARLLDGIDGTVFALGDNAYQSGTDQEFRDCYDPTWGRHKNRTRPVPGNHEYETPGAAPYYSYFGLNAGPSGRGYYSFEIGNWHAIALNSNIPAGADSPQGAWLRADLAANRTRCTIAYWHHPLFSSGKHGDQPRMREVWRLLHEAGADIVLSAHDHTYERFAPQDADGFPDAAHGIRQFVVGTGGAAPYAFTSVRSTSEVRMSTLGVLKLTLRADDYDWSFIPVSGPGDSGSGACH